MDEKLRQAIRLVLAGQRAPAKALLQEVLQANPYDEKAWMWMVEVLETPTARQRALEACLRYLPDCLPAQHGLAVLRGETFPRPGVAPALPPIAPVLPAAAAPRPTYRFPVAAFAVMMLLTVCMAGLAVGAYFLNPYKPVAVGAGSNQALDPTGDPVQYTLTNVAPFTIPDTGYSWTVTPKAGYYVTARVLSKYHYGYDPFDMRARVSPYDLAIGWGDMSDPSVDQWITWSQRGRWYYYEWVNSTPFSGQEIGLQSANTHIIPANDNITWVLDRVQINDVIYLEGYLVNIITEIDGTKWYVDSSLTRADTGDGGCEQLYVKRIIWNGQEYR
jgi:hypothetical protein